MCHLHSDLCIILVIKLLLQNSLEIVPVKLSLLIQFLFNLIKKEVKILIACLLNQGMKTLYHFEKENLFELN